MISTPCESWDYGNTPCLAYSSQSSTRAGNPSIELVEHARKTDHLLKQAETAMVY